MAVTVYIGLMLLCGPVSAGRQESPARRATDRADAETERVRDAEALLRDLRRRQSEKDVIPPASAKHRATQPNIPALLPEGSAVVAQTGSIQESGTWWIFRPSVEQGGARPCKLLPNSTLEAMVRMHRAALSPLGFTVSGELTVFHGENYLLARSAARAISSSAAGVMPGRGEPPAESAAGGPEPERWNGDSDDVLKAMRELTPQMPAVVTTDRSPVRSPARSFAPAPMMEGTSLAARAGRLVRAGEEWAFTFDSDRPDEPDAPLRLLPSRSVEFMTEAGATEASGLRFLVSGEVTEFEGQNYLIVRAATRPLEMGNLRR